MFKLNLGSISNDLVKDTEFTSLKENDEMYIYSSKENILFEKLPNLFEFKIDKNGSLGKHITKIREYRNQEAFECRAFVHSISFAGVEEFKDFINEFISQSIEFGNKKTIEFNRRANQIPDE